MGETGTLLTHHWLQPLWILFLVVMLERFLPWPDKIHPLTLVRLLATNMARKVHSDSTASVYQQKISGSLAVLVLVLPVMIIFATLITLAEFPQFFEALLLLIALQFQNVIKTYRALTRALKKEQKALARNLLSAMVLRQTDKLSPLGVAKAAIESLLLRFNYQFGTVIFWFLLAGGLGAFCYRLLFELSQCWNTKLERFQHFGQPAARLTALLAWFPSRVTAYCLALVENISGAFKARNFLQKGDNSHFKLLALKGGALSIELGGPVYYQDVKRRFKKVGGPRQVRFCRFTQNTCVSVQDSTFRPGVGIAAVYRLVCCVC